LGYLPLGWSSHNPRETFKVEVKNGGGGVQEVEYVVYDPLDGGFENLIRYEGDSWI